MAKVNLKYNLDLEDSYKWLFVTPTQTAKSTIPYVQELGLFPARENYFTTRSRLPSYLIKFCISGSGFLEYNHQKYQISENQVFWVDCKKYQHYYTDSRCGHWEILWVHFYGEQCRKYYELFLSQNNNRPCIDVGDNSLIRPIIERLFSIYENGRPLLTDDLHAASLLTQLMTQCIASVSPASSRDSAINPYISNVIEYISEHYKERITLDVLSAHCNINKYYLQKLFKKHTGITPNEYLNKIRVQHAKQLLSISSLPINEVASEVGITHNGHFIDLFKTHEGMTPSTYRKFWQIKN